MGRQVQSMWKRSSFFFFFAFNSKYIVKLIEFYNTCVNYMWNWKIDERNRIIQNNNSIQPKLPYYL